MTVARHSLLVALGALCLASNACKSQGPDSSPAPAKAAPEPERKAFGARLQPGELVSLAQVLKSPETYGDRVITVEGHVRRACTRKGCWMEMAEGADEGLQSCRVTFKDYGFFVPVDSAGSKARVQGLLKVKRVEAPTVNHLEEEGAKFANKAPDGSAQEVRLVANGVELWR